MTHTTATAIKILNKNPISAIMPQIRKKSNKDRFYDMNRHLLNDKENGIHK